jgi:SAM-dependent methyltransferase
MGFREKRQVFIDRTARKPLGEKAAHHYTNPRAHYRGFETIMEALSLSHSDDYFEIGCGGGVLLNMALEKAQTAAAMDHSPDMVNLSKAAIRKHGNEDRVEVTLGNAEDGFPWPDKSFSAGACAHMFFFVEHPDLFLREAFRVLRQGGRFAMVTMGKGLLGKIVFGWLYALRTYSNAEMREMLKTAGFSEVAVKTVRTQSILKYQLCYAVK